MVTLCAILQQLPDGNEPEYFLNAVPGSGHEDQISVLLQV